jgi:hypothetical protein
MNGFVQSAFAGEPIFGFEADLDAVLGRVSEYPIFDYSMKDVKRAGERSHGLMKRNPKSGVRSRLRTTGAMRTHIRCGAFVTT